MAPISAPDLDALYDLFPNVSDKPPTVELVHPDDVPEPYKRLLVHTHHMTVTVEEFYSQSVSVYVLDSRRHGDEYARKILLWLPGGKTVQYGLVRIDLSVCPPAVRDEIVAGKTPLGRVLIEHDMLRRIEPTAFLRADLSPTMADWFGVEPGTETYGRLGVIYTGDQPVIEVLEILAPVPLPKP